MKYFIYCRKSTDAEERQVLSIESQLSETAKLVAGTQGLEVVKVYEEARSARKPGRPIFDEMVRRIEKGDADGIISWHPDRLARNSVDGGRVIHLLAASVKVVVA
jgi:DNA invertase Pin-like site-specific DNA recombinase